MILTEITENPEKRVGETITSKIMADTDTKTNETPIIKINETPDKKNNPTPDKKEGSTLVPGFRDWIGVSIISLSGGILIALIVLATISLFSSTEKGFDNVKELFGILLPVIGTWIGTVLAFYFSKENFEAANRSVSAMVKQVTSTDEKLEELKVTDIMLKPNDFYLKKVENLDEFKACKISDLITEMEKSQSERMAILENQTLKFIFLIYRSTLERFLVGYTKGDITLNDQTTPLVAELTVQNMLESTFPLAKSIVELTNSEPFLPITSTLAQVRQKMQDKTVCQDVFITKTGNKNESVEGWITDYMIVEKAELFKKPPPKS